MSENYREALKTFALWNECKDPNILRSSNIEDSGVWLCIFENDREAQKIILETELYELLYENLDFGINFVINVFTIRCIQVIESTNPALTVDDMLKIIIDVYGDEIIPDLVESAQKFLERREEIVSHNPIRNNEWVNYARILVEKTKNLQRE